MSDYSFLKPYMWDRYKGETVVVAEHNMFFPVSDSEILEVEKMLGYSFPSQLRQFYQEIGYGYLTTPHNPPLGYEFSDGNEILPPLVVARFALGITEWEGQEHWISESVLETLKPGDLPFMEVSDSDYFLIVKPLSQDPNTVYTDTHIKLEDSFEHFIWRMYYEDPRYFDAIVEKHYANM